VSRSDQRDRQGWDGAAMVYLHGSDKRQQAIADR